MDDQETLNSERLPIYGFAILDAATAEFNLIGFEDDISRTRLETLFRQLRPQEVIHEKGGLSGPTRRVMKNILPDNCRWTALRTGAEYPNFETSLALVVQKCAAASSDANMDVDDAQPTLPAAVRAIKGDQSTVMALGGLLTYLQTLKLDGDLCKVGNFNLYELHGARSAQRMILDGQSLAHIEVLQNSLGTEEGTLLRLMSRCVTPAGKRLFKLWLCQPLCDAHSINQRLDAVEDLMQDGAFADTFVKMNKGIVDLERVLSRIHAGTCKAAVFKKALENLKTLDALFESLKSHTDDFKSDMLKKMLEKAPRPRVHVEAIEATFEEQEGLLVPCDGADDEYDENTAAIAEAEAALEKLLKSCKKELGTNLLTFKHVGTKDIYQVEVPVSRLFRPWTELKRLGRTKRASMCPPSGARCRTPRMSSATTLLSSSGSFATSRRPKKPTRPCALLSRASSMPTSRNSTRSTSPPSDSWPTSTASSP
jgi:DNA mismatch repair protein MSH6